MPCLFYCHLAFQCNPKPLKRVHFSSFLTPNTGRPENACTLVPTVFLGNRKTEFELPVSFFVYPSLRKTEFEILFSFSVFLLHWKWNLSFCFRFLFSHDFGQQNYNSHFRFSPFVFVRYWKTKFDLRFSFFVSAFLSLPYFTWTGTSCHKKPGNHGWCFGGKNKQDGSMAALGK